MKCVAWLFLKFLSSGALVNCYNCITASKRRLLENGSTYLHSLIRSTQLHSILESRWLGWLKPVSFSHLAGFFSFLFFCFSRSLLTHWNQRLFRCQSIQQALRGGMLNRPETVGEEVEQIIFARLQWSKIIYSCFDIATKV